jgi:pseudouridylate synthase
MTTCGLVLAPEVSDALATARAVVALESSVIAHGLPWPMNLETARGAETAVRAQGAIPATVAVLDGVLRAGLLERELILVAGGDPGLEPARQGDGAHAGQSAGATRPGPCRLTKANRRDLAAVLAAGGQAATTVSATLWFARRFGLEPLVMATGGLGGVHRDAAATFDVSTDLDELARADGALVVCSGVKSILDVPATLEALETRGVLVAGYGTDRLPGFLTSSSGLFLEHTVDSPAAAAALVRAHRAARLPGAIVLAQPVPPAHALDLEVMQAALAKAEGKARAARITGKALTPFLLESIRGDTGGQALRANCALLVANAALAASIAALLVESGDDP